MKEDLRGEAPYLLPFSLFLVSLWKILQYFLLCFSRHASGTHWNLELASCPWSESSTAGTFSGFESESIDSEAEMCGLSGVSRWNYWISSCWPNQGSQKQRKVSLNSEVELSSFGSSMSALGGVSRCNDEFSWWWPNQGSQIAIMTSYTVFLY